MAKTPKIKDIFWTYPAETESGRPLIVTGRDGLEPLMATGKYIYRVRVSLDYAPLPDGMPAETIASPAATAVDSEANASSAATAVAVAGDLEKITDALLAETAADPAAVITGIYTGDGRRDWIFYTRSLNIFRNIFNRALAPLPPYDFEMQAEEDPDWEEYKEMKAATYIPEEED